jgi:hypothetical protein
MHYSLMCCFNEDSWANIPKSQRDKIMQDYAKWVEECNKADRIGREPNYSLALRREPFV